jgi:hypothetical protein
MGPRRSRVRHERTIDVTSPNRPGHGVRRLLAASAAGVLALAGLSVLTNAAASGAPSAPTARAAAPAAAGEGDEDWTLMIYDVADTTNIANDMIANLAYFADMPAMDNVNVVAMVDLPERNEPGYPSATLPGIAPFSSTKLVVLDDGRWNEIQDLGELSMGRPDTLAYFIERVGKEFPASKYGLVLSDHGGAWAGGYIDNGPPSTSGLYIADMRAGIVTGMQRGDIDKFDFISHDSCLMAAYEAASALGPVADVLVASEEIIAGDKTLDLEAFAALGENVSGEEWGLANISGYADLADTAPAFGKFTAMSVVDGQAMERLDDAISAFADVAIDQMADIAPQIARARGRALEFVTGIEGEEGGAYYSVVDLGDFLRQIQDVPDDVLVARDAVFEALDRAVLHQETRRATEQATGLNVFFPETPEMARSYVAQNIAPSGWNRLVEAYADYAKQSGGGGGNGGGGNGVSFTGETADVLEIGPGGIRISAQLESGDEADVAGVETQVYTQLDGRNVLASVLPAYLNSGGVGEVQGVWNFAVTAISTGKQRAPVSAVYQAQSGGLVGWFNALYTRPDGSQTDVEISVLLSSEGEIEGIQIADLSQGGQGGFELAGGTLTPYLIVPSSGGFQFELSSKSVPVNSKTEIVYPKLARGTAFEMVLIAFDLAGNVDGAAASETVR